MRKILPFLMLVGIVTAGFFVTTMSYRARVSAQSIQTGPAGIQIPGPFVYGTSGAGSLPTCTATANVPAMDGQVAYINNQASPYPSAAFSADGVGVTATAGTPAYHAMVYCDAPKGKWYLVCP